MARYETELSNHLEGKVKLYRTREERTKMKEESRMNSLKDTWFRAGGYTSTLTVPSTPNGGLAEEVRKSLAKGRQPEQTNTKVIEDGGRSVRVGLIKSDQFPRETCNREDCPLCTGQERGKKGISCDKENIGYEGECARCPAGSFSYIGETSKTGYTRLTQHTAAYRAASTAGLPAPPQHVGDQLTWPKAPKSWMWEHTRDVHQGNVGAKDYNFKVAGRFLKCLYRQVDEDVRMKQFEQKGGELLNSKYEYFMPKSVQPVFRQQ